MTSQNEMTPWFSVDTPPSRPGVYNISCRNFDQSGTWYSYWDGEFWRSWKSSTLYTTSEDAVAEAFESRLLSPGWKNGDEFYESWTWRGITFESWCGR